jgi:hypothetical protein
VQWPAKCRSLFAILRGRIPCGHRRLGRFEQFDRFFAENLGDLWIVIH